MPGSFSWPPYAHLRPGCEAPPLDAPLQLPALVLDLFYARADAATAPELLVVLGCLGGGIMVTPSSEISTLPADLQAIIRAAEVNRRGQFRTITARELWITSLDAIEQAVQAQGYNDAVSLYGRIHARIANPGPTLALHVLANDAALTVGRLDVLYGWRMGFAAPFHHPTQATELTTHAFIPVAPDTIVQQGMGLALIYPFFDPARIASCDNTAMVMQIVYDLLLHLQHDLREHDHPLASITLPVPSRAHLEAELTADGYRIAGNTAVREAAPQNAAPASSLLGRVRRWTQQWSEPSIPLPRQATLADYQRIIDNFLSAITTPADHAMMHAILRCVGPLTTPPASARTTAQPVRGDTPNTVARPARATRSARQTSVRQGSWADDFKAPPPQPAPRQAWWDDFGQGGQREVVRSTQADWATPPPPAAPSPPASWGTDFDRAPAPPPEAPPADDWSRDFD